MSKHSNKPKVSGAPKRRRLAHMPASADASAAPASPNDSVAADSGDHLADGAGAAAAISRRRSIRARYLP